MATVQINSSLQFHQNHSLSRAELAREPFSSAAQQWFEARSVYIRPNTKRCYAQYIKTLEKFLRDIPLKDIRPGTIRSYQAWRSETAGASRCRCEIVCLQMILKEAGLWKKLKDTYRPLPIEQTKVRKNMNVEEEKRLIECCLAKPSRLVAGHCLIVMMNTSMGFGELRFVRREDVYLDVDRPFVVVNGGSKNEYRRRSITLNRVALNSVRWMLHRWEELGGSEPEQYILPHRSVRGSGTQFQVPMGYINTAAKLILKDAGLSNMVPYDMRSHFITRVLSNPDCSDQVYSELVGHTPKDKQMRMRYSSQRLETKASVTDWLCEGVAPPPPAQSPAPSSIMSPEVQAEIARMVALVLQQQREAEVNKLVAAALEKTLVG